MFQGSQVKRVFLIVKQTSFETKRIKEALANREAKKTNILSRVMMGL